MNESTILPRNETAGNGPHLLPFWFGDAAAAAAGPFFSPPAPLFLARLRSRCRQGFGRRQRLAELLFQADDPVAELGGPFVLLPLGGCQHLGFQFADELECDEFGFAVDASRLLGHAVR